jgi:hypothetical protein
VLRAGVKAVVVGVVLQDGTCPAKEFLDELQAPQFEARMEAFGAMGTLRVTEQLNKASSEGRPIVWEIKAEKHHVAYRLYGVRVGAKFVATHGSVKRKPNVLKQEVAKAREIYTEWKKHNE